MATRYPVCMGIVYLTALLVAFCVSVVRSRWPVQILIGCTAVITGMSLSRIPESPVEFSAWVQSVWVPFESVALILSIICLTVALLRETEHRDRILRLWFRIGVICIPVAIAGSIWLFDPHNTIVTIFYAGRARFWQGMGLAWFIAWCNTGWGKRMSQDGILCLCICILRGIAVSFPPSDEGQMIFRATMSLSLLSWSARYPLRGGLRVLPLPPQPSPIPLV